MDSLCIKKDCAVQMLDTKFIKVYDLQYAPDKHYYDATRRTKENLMAIKTDEELKSALPDAVSCIVILEIPGEEPRLCVMKEYRYPTGRFVLSVPSGLVDQADENGKSPVFSAAIREVKEETGLIYEKEKDEIVLVNPLLFCSPGLTDESTAVVKLAIKRDSVPQVSDAGAVGAEIFSEGTWITKEEAKEYLKKGTDEQGIFYSAITWIALMTFVSDLW